MGKKAVSTLALILLLGACGKNTYDNLQNTPTDPNIPAVGAWEPNSGQVTRSSGGTAKIRFKITKDSFTHVVHCEFKNGTVLDVSVTANAKVDSKSIEVLEDKKNSDSSNGYKCSATIEKGKVDYVVNGKQMELRAGGNSLTLTRL